MNILELPHVKELLTLLAVMGANIAFGIALSELKQEFDWRVMKKGIFKGVTVVVGIALFSFVSYYNNDLQIGFNGGQYSINDVMVIIIHAAIVAYAADGLNKLAKIFKFKSTNQEEQVNDIID